MSKKNNKIIKYKKPVNVNIALVICSAIFIYLIVFSFISLSRDKITIYEVSQGQSANKFSSQYRALIMREETVAFADKSGYISFYSGEGSVVSVGSKIYAIDSRGTISEAIKDATSQGDIIVNDNSGEIKTNISQFNNKFNELDFNDIYDFKYLINSSLVDTISGTIIDKINSEGNLSLNFITTSISGILTHYTDGFESVKQEEITSDLFEKSYKKNTISSNDLVEVNTPIYKIVTSDKWSLLFPLTEDTVQKYKDKTSLKVKILKDDIVVSADFEIVKLSDGSYGKISLDKYMIRYINDRFIDLSIYEDTIEGYKIPMSSVIKKDFFIIPSGYISTGGNSNKKGFNKQVYDESGNVSVQFVTPTIYKQTDDYYYIDNSSLKSGDIIVMNDSTATYQISATEALEGVYNVNAGYTEFRVVEILTKANEYYIVKNNTFFGLSNYDNIVQDATSVKENQVVFQ